MLKALQERNYHASSGAASRMPRALLTGICDYDTPHYTVARVMHVTPVDKRRRTFYVDPWRALCEHCRLDDCIRTEATYQRSQPSALSRLPVYDAAAAGLTVERHYRR
jgi:hypothetical protein